MLNKIIVTTTNSVEGKEIDKYIDIISDRIVVGAGLYSEIFAAFTDIVGGRSGKFEDRMHELYNNLMSSLESQARKLRADAIIGLKIDMDEISGKSSQMFMISGIGTAVKFKNNNENDELPLENDDSEIFITNQEVRLNKLSNTSMKLLDSIDELSKSDNINRDIKTKDQLIQTIEEAMYVSYSNYEFLVQLSKLIIINVDNNNYIDSLITYGNANYPDSFNSGLVNALQEIFKNGTITAKIKSNWNYLASRVAFNFKDKTNLINAINSNFWEDYIFPVLQKEVDIYHKNDLSLIAELINGLKNVELVEPDVQKSKLSQVWVCSCGNKNNLNTEICICGRNKFGLKNDFNITLEKIILNLQSVLECANKKTNQ